MGTAHRAIGCAAWALVGLLDVGCRSQRGTDRPTRPPSTSCLERQEPWSQRQLQAIFSRAEVTTRGWPPGVPWVVHATPHRDDEAEVLKRRAQASAWVEEAPDDACRDRRLVTVIGERAMFGGIEAQAREAITRLDPDDPAWSASPGAVIAVAEALPTGGPREDFLRDILERHPDPEVRAVVLFDEMRRCWDEGDDDRVAELFSTLSSPPYADTSMAVFVPPYDPNHPLAAGRRLPGFSVPRLNGQGTLTPADLDGEVNLLVLWGTHCPPCVEGMPALHELAAAHPELRVVSIAVGDSPDAVLEFRERFPMPWTHGYLDDGELHLELVRALGWGHVPQYLLVDREGTILAGPPRLDLDGVRAYLER